jgi:phosphohistidine phosphatase
MTLWLIRHAKSAWDAGVASDFDRPLNARGERDGPRMARWLAAQPDPAGWIWSSDAARAQATTRFVAVGFAAAAPELILDHRLYLAGPERLLEVVRETPADIGSVAVVAHNPGLTELVNLLAGRTVTDNLPTFGVARFELTDPWEDVRFGSARLALLMAPKRLGDAV